MSNKQVLKRNLIIGTLILTIRKKNIAEFPET